MTFRRSIFLLFEAVDMLLLSYRWFMGGEFKDAHIVFIFGVYESRLKKLVYLYTINQIVSNL